jgi:dihydrofolate reductase
MAKLTYTALTSLDGIIEDESGKFDWAAPDPEVHQFVNDLMRPAGTHLYGRRMYETMAIWQTVGLDPTTPTPPEELDFAELWRSADKIVYSRTLTTVSTPRTLLEPEFDPDSVRELKSTATHDLIIGGASLAHHAFEAELIDEIHLFVIPVIIGAGKPALPKGRRVDLELLDEHRFPNGTVHLHYGTR